jgi:aldose 1-epimerase
MSPWRELFSQQDEAGNGIRSHSLVWEGATVTFYEMSCDGFSFILCNYGARLLSFQGPDGVDVLLSMPTLSHMLNDSEYMGATIGRVCNRIRGAQLPWNDGRSIELSANEGANQLHGGRRGFDKQFWEVVTTNSITREPSITLQYLSKDGEEGYPGTLLAQARMTLKPRGELEICYESRCLDTPTVANLTQHAYWNLSGPHGGPIGPEQELLTTADRVLELDSSALPTGRIRSSSELGWNFRQGQSLLASGTQSKPEHGINHFFLSPPQENQGELWELARVTHVTTGRSLIFRSNQPGFQLYTGSYLKVPFQPSQGFCIEASGYVDAPHHPEFPSILLRPGELRRQVTSIQLVSST